MTITVTLCTMTDAHVADGVPAALPADTTDADRLADAWLAELEAVPDTIAWRAARSWRAATVVIRGTGGETTGAWFYNRTGGGGTYAWMHHDGYNDPTPVDDAAVGAVGDGDPQPLEILDWRDNEYRRDEMDALADAETVREYERAAVRALRRGQAAAFRAAVERLHEADPTALDPGLYARLTGRDAAEAADAEPYDDEDARYHNTS